MRRLYLLFFLILPVFLTSEESVIKAEFGDYKAVFIPAGRWPPGNSYKLTYKEKEMIEFEQRYNLIPRDDSKVSVKSEGNKIIISNPPDYPWEAKEIITITEGGFIEEYIATNRDNKARSFWINWSPCFPLVLGSEMTEIIPAGENKYNIFWGKLTPDNKRYGYEDMCKWEETEEEIEKKGISRNLHAVIFNNKKEGIGFSFSLEEMKLENVEPLYGKILLYKLADWSPPVNQESGRRNIHLSSVFKDVPPEGKIYLKFRISHFESSDFKIKPLKEEKNLEKLKGVFADATVEDKDFLPNIIPNSYFENNLKGWEINHGSLDKEIKKEGSQSVKISDSSEKERADLIFRSSETEKLVNKNAGVYISGWFYLEDPPEGEFRVLGLGSNERCCLILNPEKKIGVRSFNSKRWESCLTDITYPVKKWFKLSISYNKKENRIGVYYNDNLMGEYPQKFSNINVVETIYIAESYPDESKGDLWIDNLFIGSKSLRKVKIGDVYLNDSLLGKNIKKISYSPEGIFTVSAKINGNYEQENVIIHKENSFYLKVVDNYLQGGILTDKGWKNSISFDKLKNNNEYEIGMSYDKDKVAGPFTGAIEYSKEPVLSANPSGWDQHIREKPWVIYEDGKYHMWYAGWKGQYGKGVCRIGYATSEDGINWEKYGENPVIEDPGAEDPTVVKFKGKYFLAYELEKNVAGEGRAVIKVLSSDDKIHWESISVIEPGEYPSWDYREVGTPVLWVEDEKMYLFYEARGGVPLNWGEEGLATSEDGINWEKYGKNPVIKQSPPDVFVASDGITRYKGNYYMYYHSPAGLAISTDLIHWNKSPYNPLGGSALMGHICITNANDKYLLYYTTDKNNGVYLAYPSQACFVHLNINGKEVMYKIKDDTQSLSTKISDAALWIGSKEEKENIFDGEIKEVKISDK